MYILGIKPSIGGAYGWHDGGSCLLKDERIIAIAEEERFTKKKRAEYQFPSKSIQFALDQENISLTDINVLAIGRDPYIEPNYPNKSPSAKFRQLIINSGKQLLGMGPPDPLDQVIQKLESLDIGRVPDQIEFINHHLCHAASAAYCSPFDNPVTATIDARGEADSTVLWDKNLNKVGSFTYCNSVGYFYSYGCEYLGFRGERDAGKVMGLAPYGTHRPEFKTEFDELIQIENGEYDVTSITLSDDPVGLLEKRFGKKREYPEEINQHHKDFAFHLQQKTEEIAKELVRNHIDHTGISALALAGGVAMNCKMNREILNMACVDDLFIQPAANDSGICLGAALETYHRITGKKPDIEFEHVYYGSKYSNDEINSTLSNYKIEFEKLDNISIPVAELLADGHLVGWFQGRMEYGARALGNRSILANPKDQKYMDKVNSNVKGRESWRPFAPSMLYSIRNEYLEHGDEASFMILLDDVKEDKQEEIPAVTHVDGTTRPQTVRKQSNKKYYQLIKKFGDLTDAPVILNTSFNKAGDPIIESPTQAIETFYSTGLDALALEDNLITKPEVSVSN
jgi:carbamoyltransferase